MSKVIDMRTKQEIVQQPHSKEEGEALIEALLEFEIKNNAEPFSSMFELIGNTISMVENNTGAHRFEVMNRLYEKRRV